MFSIARRASCCRASCRRGRAGIRRRLVEPPVGAGGAAGHLSRRRPTMAAGTSAATSTITGRTSAARLHRPTASAPRSRQTSISANFDERLVARRRRRLPDQQLSAHRPDRRLAVQVRFHRLRPRHLGVNPVFGRHVVLQRAAAAGQCLCRYRHLVRHHALCRRRHRRRLGQVGRSQQHASTTDALRAIAAATTGASPMRLWPAPPTA